jgi:hypothetical protein
MCASVSVVLAVEDRTSEDYTSYLGVQGTSLQCCVGGSHCLLSSVLCRPALPIRHYIGTVHGAYYMFRAYEGIEGRKNTNKDMKNKKM